MIPRLHLVTDDRVLALPGFSASASEAMDAGGERIALHLRGPRTEGRRLWALGSQIAPVARSRGTALLVNDRIDLALVLAADGVHLGARSFPVSVARELVGSERLLGRSVHGMSEAAEIAGGVGPGRRVDYLYVGTLHPTPSHPGRPAAGPSRIREIAAACPDTPLIGIGGVRPEAVGSVIESGGYGVAVIRAVWDAVGVGSAVEGLLDHLRAATASEHARIGGARGEPTALGGDSSKSAVADG